jgi:TolB protein
MRKVIVTLCLVTAVATALVLAAAPSYATSKGANGLLVFQRQVGKHVQLFTIRPDGSGTRQVTHLTDSDALGGQWSPDGARIVFARDYAVGTPSEHLDIEVIDADGRNAHSFGLQGLNGYPVWSPDGKRILWLRAPGFAIANPDGAGMQLVRVPGENSSLAFSPDGRRIALRRDIGGGTAI